MDTTRVDSGGGGVRGPNTTATTPHPVASSSLSTAAGLLAPNSPGRARPKRHEKRSGSAQRMDGLLRHSSGLGTSQSSGSIHTTPASPNISTTAPINSHLSRPFPSTNNNRGSMMGSSGSVGGTTASSSNNSSYSRHHPPHPQNQPPVSSSPGSPRPSNPQQQPSSSATSKSAQASCSTNNNPPSKNNNKGNNTYEIDMKVVVLGQGNCGKSSFINKLVHGTFARNRPATIGVDYQSRSFELEFDGLARLQRQYGGSSSSSSGGGGGPPRVLLKLNLWDIAGQEDCGIGTSTYYQGAKAAIIVYDVTSPASLAKAVAWKKDLDKKASFDEGGMFRIPAILVGNKTDLVAYPLPLADSQELYQRTRRNSLRKSDKGSTASHKGAGGGGIGLRRPSSTTNRVDSGTTRGSTASNVTAPHRGSMASGAGGHRPSHQRPSSSIYDDEEDGYVYDDGDEYDDDGNGVHRGRRSTASDCGMYIRSQSNNSSAVPSSSTAIPSSHQLPHTRGRTGSRILDAEQVASDALHVGSIDNSPNGFVDVSVVAPPVYQQPTSTHHQDPTSIARDDQVLTTPRRGEGGSGGGVAGGTSGMVRTHSSSRFLTPNPFNASKGDDLDAMIDEGRSTTNTTTANCVDEDNVAVVCRTQSGRPRTPIRSTYDNKSRRGSMTALGTPGLKSPNRRVDGGSDVDGGGTRSRRHSVNISLHLDVLSPRGSTDAVDTPMSPDPPLPTTDEGVVAATTLSTTDDVVGSSLSSHQAKTVVDTSRLSVNAADSITLTPTQSPANPGNGSIGSNPGGRSSVAQNLRRSYHNHQLQQAAALEKQHQDSRMAMPETKQQVQDFINEYRFAGHFFSSARSGLSVDEIAEYTLQSILKMDPHGTDDIERELRGETANASSSARRGGGGRIGISGGGGKITKASMSASPSRRGGKKRQQTRFGGCEVQ